MFKDPASRTNKTDCKVTKLNDSNSTNCDPTVSEEDSLLLIPTFPQRKKDPQHDTTKPQDYCPHRWSASCLMRPSPRTYKQRMLPAMNEDGEEDSDSEGNMYLSETEEEKPKEEEEEKEEEVKKEGEGTSKEA
ncbi:unnamed protein product [Cylindrotheca closterium]|uniref:Uncharacterized protein n=1 Tax=Cylindrotheca closterium TaxID=2856 RepID=A0AAD2CV19_9STRA|nr:unnamed protein product [Cylindrotheca closterium]